MLRSLITVLVLFISTLAYSTTHLVTNTNDSGTGSIRAAIALCASSGDTVRLSPSLIAAGSDTIHLQSELYFSKSIVFKGVYNATDTLYLSGEDSVRVMHAYTATFVELDSLVIINGSASQHGAGLSCNVGADLIIRNSVFTNNSSSGNSSAVYFFNSGWVPSSFYMENSILQGGTGFAGKAMQISADSIEIRTSRFVNNNSTGFNGGALDINTIGTVFVDSCDFIGNSCLNGPGAIEIESYNFQTVSSISLSNLVVQSNVGDEYGGVVIRDCEKLVLSDSRFEGNFATDSTSFNSSYKSGAFSLETDYADTLIIQNTEFISNGSHLGGLAANLFVTGKLSGVDSVVVRFEGVDAHDNYKVGTIGGNKEGGVLTFTSWEHYRFYAENCNIQDNDLTNINNGGLYVYTLKPGNIEVSGCELTNNLGASFGGGISLDVDSLTTGVIEKSKFIGNSSQNQGGGLMLYSYVGQLDFTIDSCEFRNNTGGFGGGAGLYAFASDSTHLLVQNSKFENNSTTNTGGGMLFWASADTSMDWNVECVNLDINANSAESGAGISFQGINSDFSAEIKESTISNNNANLHGGAVLVNGRIQKSLLISHSTISGNHANMGGAIYDSSHVYPVIPYVPGSFSIVNSTVIGNTSVIGAAISSEGPNGELQFDTIISSVFFGNSPSSFSSANLAFNSGGYNIFEATSVTGSVTSDQLNVDSTSLNLGPLQYNGGFTKTHMPISPSVAIDMGNPADLSSAQNAFVNGVRDVGAAEVCANQTVIDTSFTCDSLTWINGHVYASNTMDTIWFQNAAGCDSLVILNLVVLTDTVFNYNEVACDSFLWANGETYYSDTMLVDTFPSSLGCDSIVALNLTINHSNSYTDTIVACNNYTWIDGNTYASNNNSATHMLTTAKGCDSLVILNLTILNSSFAVDTVVACDSYTWINGQTYTSNNTSAVHIMPNAVGCDSIVTLNLTINSSSASVDSVIACNSYTWLDGVTYTTSNYSATHTYTNAVGCDSIVTLHLDLDHDSNHVHTIVSCDSFSWNGTVYTNSIIVADTFASALGCDSIVTLDLTINQATYAVDTIVSCDSYNWINGQTYTTSNTTATHTLVNAAGCDSVVTLNLTILQSSAATQTYTACNSFTWFGTTYTSSNNTATFTLPNAVGCDSVISLNLTINYPQNTTDSVLACNSYTWLNGVTYTASNNTDTMMYTSSAGCDSIVTLNLTIVTDQATTDNVTACNSYLWDNGQTYTSSQTVIDTFQTVYGCDSVVTLNLTINNTSYGVDVVSACDSYTWIDGQTYTTSNNTATHTLTNAAGCDSVVTLDLTMLNSSTGTHSITVCNSYTWHGITYTASNNTATHTYTNGVGCDSVVTLDLTILNNTTSVDQITACNSYTWLDGVTYNASNNTATYTLPNAAGCDSIISLDLTIVTDQVNTENVTVCNSYTWTNGQTYTASQTVIDTFQTIYGCDSVVTLNLVVNYPTSFTDVIQSCDSYTWIDGQVYTASNNTATYTITNAVGCDSVITLDLTILNSSSATDVITACNNYTWINGVTYTASNYVDTVILTNAQGCDSIVTLDLTINTVDTSVVENGVTLTAQAIGAQYQWIDCATNTPIIDSVNVSFTASESGTYAVEVTQNGCTDTSACFAITNVGIESVLTANTIKVYPNPTENNFTVELNGNGQNMNVQVLDAVGKTVYQKQVQNVTEGTTLSIVTNQWASGYYLLKVQAGDEVHNEKLILR